MLWSIFILFFYFKKKTNFNFWVCLLYILVLVWLFLLCKIKEMDKIVGVVKWMGMIGFGCTTTTTTKQVLEYVSFFVAFKFIIIIISIKLIKRSLSLSLPIFFLVSPSLLLPHSQTQILNYLLFKIKN
jgi:hypothetical protein